MAFGQTPVSTTTLSTNQFPVSAVAVPGEPSGNLTALKGGPKTTDSNSNDQAPAAMYVYDGNDVAQGAMADAAVISPAGSGSVIALLKGLLTELIDIEAQTTTTPVVSGTVSVSNLPSTQATNITQFGSVATQMATADGVAQANVPEFAIGLYNSSGSVIDRLRDAGSVGDGVTIGFIAAQQMLFNGGSGDRARTPTAFVPIAAQSITAGAPVAVWTPTGGRKFHLMGYCVTSTVSASIIFKDGTTEIFRVPVLAGAPATNPGNFGNGYASNVSNQALNFDVTTTGAVSGFVFGTSEF